MLIDLHVHSRASRGGAYDLATLCREARERGLDGICVTDVHQVQPALEARARLDGEPLTVLVGFEACTDQGHFLVFVPEPQRLPPIDAWLRFGTSEHANFSSLLEAVKAHHGVLIAAHPYDRRDPANPGDKLYSLPGLAAVEVINGRCDKLCNELAEEMAATMGLPGVAGSATLDSLDSLGRAATLLAGPAPDEATLIDRLLAGDAWAATLEAPGKSDRPQRRRPRKRSRSRSSAKPAAKRPGRPASAKSADGQQPAKTPRRRPRRRRPKKQTNRD